MRIGYASMSPEWFAVGVQPDDSILTAIAASASRGILDRARRGDM
jgi:hypothetical protein